MRTRRGWHIAILLALAIVIIPNEAEAQSEPTLTASRYEFSDSLGCYRVTFRPWGDTPRVNSRRLSPVEIDYHELRLGIAANDNIVLWTSDYWPEEFGNRYKPTADNSTTYLSDFEWYTLNADYGYWVRKWLYVGVAATYSGGFCGEYHKFSDQRMSSRSMHIIGILPQLRFAWLNRNIVQLYSSVALGALFSIGAIDNKARVGVARVGLDFKFVGISVGRRWFGFAELGYGHRGIINAGFGCRFGATRRE